MSNLPEKEQLSKAENSPNPQTMDLSYEKQILQVHCSNAQQQPNTFHPINLWKPVGNRGAFGGQLLSHATHAMIQTVDRSMHICSLHSHYILSARLDLPISYNVERVRDGVTYASRSVKGIQNEKTVFLAFALFKKRQAPSSLAFEETKTLHFKDPELCPRIEWEWQDACKKLPNPHFAFVKYSVGKVEMEPRIVETRSDKPEESGCFSDENGSMPAGKNLWIRAGFPIGKNEVHLHYLVLAYASDQYFLATAVNPLGMNFFSPKIKHYTTLDHTIWIHADTLDMNQWHFYRMETIKYQDERALVIGKLYSHPNANLVATVVQEGAIRIASL